VLGEGAVEPQAHFRKEITLFAISPRDILLVSFRERTLGSRDIGGTDRFKVFKRSPLGVAVFKRSPLGVALLDQAGEMLPFDLALRLCGLELRTRRRISGVDPGATLAVLVDLRLQPRLFRQGPGQFRLQIVERGLRAALELTDGELLSRGHLLLQPRTFGRMGHLERLPFRRALIDQVGQALPLRLVLGVCRLELRTRRRIFGADPIPTLPVLVDRGL
jgi:hypothetical protein